MFLEFSDVFLLVNILKLSYRSFWGFHFANSVFSSLLSDPVSISCNFDRHKRTRSLITCKQRRLNKNSVDLQRVLFMDWNFKASWVLTELEQATLPNIGIANASARYGVTRTENDFSVDLKLGQVGNSSGESVKKLKETGVSQMAPSPSGSSKRARALNNGTQSVACLVDGCNSDLSNCRDYHRRHKVCEIHSKTPQVTVSGQKQRFCQQCSRFHSLDEFDEGKRSCRKRLDGHNRRRRKPQPEPITRAATFLSTYQGRQLLPLATSQIYPSTSVVNPSWTGVVTSEEDARLQNEYQQMHLVDKRNLFMRSSGTSYKENKQYPFLQEENPRIQCSMCFQGSPSQSIIRTSIGLNPMVLHGDQARQNISCNSIGEAHESHRALSLLSLPQTQTITEQGLNPMVQPETFFKPLVQQPLCLSLLDHNFELVDSVMVTTGAGGSNLHDAGMYNVGSDKSQGNDASQEFPFTWD